MAISNSGNIAILTGNGVTQEFSFANDGGPVIVYDASHFSAFINGVLTAAYTLAGIGEDTGLIVTFNTAPADNAQIILLRTVPLTQETDLADFDGNPADVLERQFDLNVMAIQQLQEEIDRSIKVSLGNEPPSDEAITAVESLAVISDEIVAVAAIESDITTAASNIVAIQNASANAATATTQAGNAANSATASANSATDAANSAAGVNLPSITATDTGKLLLVNAAGDAHELIATNGTPGQVLTSNGDDALPSYQDAEEQNLVLLETQIASTSTSINFTTGIDDTYTKYIIEFFHVVPTTDSTQLLFTVSTDGGSNFISSGYGYYDENPVAGTATYAASTNASAASIILATGLGNGTGESMSGSIELLNPSNATKYKQILYSSSKYNDNGSLAGNSGFGGIPTTSAINAVRIASSGATIASGVFKLYGVR